MSLIFIDWKTPDEERDNMCAIGCANNDICGLSEEDLRKICKERIIGCLIPLMNLFLMAFVWMVSLSYGSVLMPSVLTVIIIVLYMSNYLEEHAIRYAIADLMHLRHENSHEKSKDSVLERSDSNQSKNNYFNYSKSYGIETIVENNEFDESRPQSGSSAVQ